MSHENFGDKPAFEKIIFQPQKNFETFFDENFWLEPVFEYIILQQIISDKKVLTKILGVNLFSRK